MTAEDGGAWYAIQTYSGHENKVKRLIEHRVEQASDDNVAIEEVLIPTQEVMEIKKGKRVQTTKRLYPGYVLIRMEPTQASIHLINSIQGVIKFIGGSGDQPQPLRDEEMRKILGIETEEEEVKEEVPFHVGQVVEVTEGPFSDFSGTVQEVYADKGKAKVEVSLFGRPTSVELDFTQLKGY